jgi:hypothetical protein
VGLAIVEEVQLPAPLIDRGSPRPAEQSHDLRAPDQKLLIERITVRLLRHTLKKTFQAALNKISLPDPRNK